MIAAKDPFSAHAAVGGHTNTLIYLLRGYRHGFVMVYGQCDFFTSL
jgi:hypothetical protein